MPLSNVVTPTKTDGLSPKVYVPALGQIIVGVVLLILGLDVEGRTAIGTGLGTLLLGFSAKPGDVIVEEPEYDPGAGDVPLPADADPA